MHVPPPSTVSMAPTAPLRPFVSRLWHSVSPALSHSGREHVLPTGQMHLVFRLAGPPLRVFTGEEDLRGTRLDGPVIGGVRMAYYVKQTCGPVVSIGAQLLPGAARLLFGVSADELAGQHTLLASVWKGQADSTLNRLGEASLAGVSPAQQLAQFDAMLRACLAPLRGVHPQVAQVLAQLHKGMRIDALVESSAYSHRALNVHFKQAAGIPPKRYARLLRFQHLLQRLHASQLSLSELAFDAGYSDQPHMQREFRLFAGLTPAQYRELAPQAANHVSLAAR